MARFKDFLEQNKDRRDSKEADFIQDALMDTTMENFTSWKALRLHLTLMGACEGAMIAAKNVWQEYKGR